MRKLSAREKGLQLQPPKGSPEMARFDAVVEGVWGWGHLENAKWHRPDCCEVSLFGPLATFDFNEMTRLVVLCHDHKVRAEVSARAGRLSVLLSLRSAKPHDAMADGHPTLERHVACIRDRLNGNQEAYTVMYREMENERHLELSASERAKR